MLGIDLELCMSVKSYTRYPHMLGIDLNAACAIPMAVGYPHMLGIDPGKSIRD